MFVSDFQTCHWRNHNLILVACIIVDAFFWLLRSASLSLLSGNSDSVFITVLLLSHAWIRFVFSVIIGIHYLLVSMWIANHVIMHMSYLSHSMICHMQPFLRMCFREFVVCFWCHCIQVLHSSSFWFSFMWSALNCASFYYLFGIMIFVPHHYSSFLTFAFTFFNQFY